ncbi:pyridine nucleotide disulfide oxidoreductase [Trichuris trichiura]|uniref:Pyridine nucleotide-disulfide oxidoreductase domain-containing protein 1 n=1 Tax=Trichuris trichiura TaxID=36087 RepID=A0A077ZB56_TRITR|nr:pyridine nucleotide disulfide oxidoreductase [Trichuris trichiura]
MDLCEATFIVVGGGVAAMSCVEQLAMLCPDESILMLTASNVVKIVSNWQKVGAILESFDVSEMSVFSVTDQFSNVKVVSSQVVHLNSPKKEIKTIDGQTFKYRKLCLATGGRPKIIADHPNVIGIRDTETVEEFGARLKNARRIVVVGNGGIATEIVGEVSNVEIIWAVKHESISAAFVDAGAAQFFLPYLNKENTEVGPKKRLTYTHHVSDQSTAKGSEFGSALGPDWIETCEITGALEKRRVHIEYKCAVKEVLSKEQCLTLGLNEEKLPPDFIERETWPVYIRLSNDNVVGCDFVVSATGVVPNVGTFVTAENPFNVADDGGLLINDQMETSVQDVYAAGDSCTAGWEPSPHWLQMRLWTQARQMGAFAGRCMASNFKGEQMELDICFELFTHVTKFFGFKVILIGCFNGQGLRPDHEALVRIACGEEYIKILVQDGYVQGAVLIGETGLEEVVENLIMNHTDISRVKDDLLNPTIDLEDYFD